MRIPWLPSHSEPSLPRPHRGVIHFLLRAGLLGGLIVAPAQAASLSGTVVDSTTGEPLRGVKVQAWDLRLARQEATTDKDGVFVIDDLHDGRWRLRAVPASGQAQVQAFWPSEAQYCEGELLDPATLDGSGVDFQLRPGSTISGRLLAVEGAWVEGAVVVAQGAESSTEYTERYALSQADGSFEIQGLDAPDGGTGIYTLAVSATGRPAQYYDGTYDSEYATWLSLTRSSSVDIGTWSLSRGIAVEGMITRESTGDPIEGAIVNVYSDSQVLSTETDSKGLYRVVGLPPSDAILPWASESGLATTYYPDNDRPMDYLEELAEAVTVEGADITLPQEARFLGTLTGEKSKGFKDYSEVTVVLYNDTYTVGRGVRANADGSFSIDALHGGSYTLQVYAADEGHQDDFLRDSSGLERIFELTAGTDNNAGLLELPLGASIAGLILDDSSRPVHGAYVWIENVETGDTEVAVSAVDGTWLARGLPEGRVSLHAYYSHYCDQDPGYVEVWWPDQLEEIYAATIDIPYGSSTPSVDFVLPVDDDHDMMADSWERENDLDPTRDDSLEDPDGDGYTNLEEYRLGTDPHEVFEESEGLCGCGGSKDSASTSLSVNPGLLLLFPAFPILFCRRRPSRRILSERAGHPSLRSQT